MNRARVMWVRDFVPQLFRSQLPGYFRWPSFRFCRWKNAMQGVKFFEQRRRLASCTPLCCLTVLQTGIHPALVERSKRHIATDTDGNLIVAVMHQAGLLDRDGAPLPLEESRHLYPRLQYIFADAGYQGPKMAAVVAGTGAWELKVVTRSEVNEFVVLPKHWIDVRTFV